MKTLVSLAFALSSIVTVSAAQAQDRQVIVYNGPVAIELPASLLRGNAPTAGATASDTIIPRKVRIIVPSPYGS